MLAKDSVGTAVAGLIFLGACVVGRPMMFYAAQRFSATSEKQAWWNIKWQTSPSFRRGFRVMSMVWGVGLLIEATVRIPLIYVLPIHVMVGLSTVLQAAVFTLLIAWTMWYGKRGRARQLARPDRDSAPNSAFHRHGNRYSAPNADRHASMCRLAVV